MELKEAVARLNDADKAVRDAAMGAVLTAKQGAIPALVDGLKAPGAPVAKIALLLAALKARDAVRPLAEMMHKGLLDFDARAVVARAFAELVDGRDAFDDLVKRAVIHLSKDTNATTRQLSVKALAAIGDGECEGRLAEMTADADAGTKASAAEALAALRAARPQDASSSSTVTPDGGLHLDLEAALQQQQAQPRGLPAPTGPYASVVVKLRDPRWAMRNAAVEEAVQAGKAVVPTLVEVLGEPHAGAKIGAAQALARIQSPDAAQALLDVAVAEPKSDDEKQLRPIALKALACSLTGAEEGFSRRLLPLVRDADPFVRAGALLCLGRLADRVGARAATVALTDPHEHVKEAAAVALSEGTREDDQDLVLPLLAVLGGMPSPSIAVREAILLALARIHVDDAATLLRLRHRVRPSVLGMTSSLRRTAIAILERCYSPEDPPPLAIVDDVLGRLADEHPEVRLLAASFLAQHLEPGMTGAVEALEDALDREEKTVSLLCLEALRRHDTAKAKLALEAACEDPDEAVAARAKELLDGFTPKTEEWTAPAVEAVVEPAPVADAAQPAPAPEPPSTSRRVRPARGGGDVVEAKDGADVVTPKDAPSS
jgi:HEAT repeat protein